MWLSRENWEAEATLATAYGLDGLEVALRRGFFGSFKKVTTLAGRSMTSCDMHGLLFHFPLFPLFRPI